MLANVRAYLEQLVPGFQHVNLRGYLVAAITPTPEICFLVLKH